MFDIYIIQDLQDNWSGTDLLYRVLQDENGQEEITLVDTDSSNQEFMETIKLTQTPGIVFIKSLSDKKHVVMDRIVEPVSYTKIKERYLRAKSSPIIFGDASGVPVGDIIDLNPMDGDDRENDPFGFGLFNFNINLPQWAWFLVSGLAAYRALTRQQGRTLYLAASAATFYAGYKKFKNEE